MPFYHLVTNEELDQAVVVTFSAKALLFMLDGGLSKRLGWVAGEKVIVTIDNDQSPNQVKISRSTNPEQGWLVEAAKKKAEDALSVSVRQLATVKLKNRRRVDAMVNDGEIILTLPKEYEVAQPGMVRKGRKSRSGGGEMESSAAA